MALARISKADMDDFYKQCAEDEALKDKSFKAFNESRHAARYGRIEGVPTVEQKLLSRLVYLAQEAQGLQ